MKSSFQQATAGCVIASFSSEAEAAANETMIVQAVLDGTTICKPDDNYFVVSNATATGLADRAMNYICPSFSAGHHYIAMQFKSLGGGAVSLDYRSLLVLYQHLNLVNRRGGLFEFLPAPGPSRTYA